MRETSDLREKLHWSERNAEVAKENLAALETRFNTENAARISAEAECRTLRNAAQEKSA